MSNKANTSRTRQLAIRLPLDVSDELEARVRRLPSLTRKALVIAALRVAWNLWEKPKST